MSMVKQIWMTRCPDDEDQPLIERDNKTKNEIKKPNVYSCVTETQRTSFPKFFEPSIMALFLVGMLGIASYKFDTACFWLVSLYQVSSMQPEKTPAILHSRPGFPSYLDFAGSKAINVSYDGRSFFLNSERALFLSGSMHPVRTTEAMWLSALDEAARSGLNMVTIYVMWSAHQPFRDQSISWKLPVSPLCTGHSCNTAWELSDALWAAAERGLFVHIRLGPYVCAEYSYGGIPEWLPLEHPYMDMRRFDSYWMKAMQGFLTETTRYLETNKLFAYQGGPVLFAQIENELGDDGSLDAADSHVDGSLQKYADWCGELAQSLVPSLIWTMCNGLSANNTISTFNGDFSAPEWLEKHGDSGRIQVDHPAMWTEDEGGFQIWGEEPSRPTDYYWGRNARNMAYTTMQWFARGGSHLNYYMWFGGQNFERMAAAGITTMYASDAILCSSGQRHEPKFTHFLNLHNALADVAHVLMNSPSALFKDKPLRILTPEGVWTDGIHQELFAYGNTNELSEVMFAENNGNQSTLVRIPATSGEVLFEMEPFSALLVVDGVIKFDSSSIQPSGLSFHREFNESTDILDCTSWTEPVGTSNSSSRHSAAFPLEQTMLLVNASTSSDYAWYETNFSTNGLRSAKLYIETAQANAMSVYLNGRFAGASDTHNHKEGNATLDVNLGKLEAGEIKLSILSESLGYGNLIGRWGGSTRSKSKGIIGNVWLAPSELESNISLVDGRMWESSPGLNGPNRKAHKYDSKSNGGVWSSAHFATPSFHSTAVDLFVEMTLGRGHVYLNGNNLGRFWNITRGNTTEQSQKYYYLPQDLLASSSSSNELVWFDAFGGGCEGARLVTSWIEPGQFEFGFKDEVAFPQACI